MRHVIVLQLKDPTIIYCILGVENTSSDLLSKNVPSHNSLPKNLSRSALKNYALGEKNEIFEHMLLYM